VVKKVINLAVLFGFLASAAASANAEVPDWLRNAAKQPTKTYAADVDAVILMDEQVTTVNERGEIQHHGRRALKILRPEGRELARFSIDYDSDSKINYLRGWSITPGGQEYEAKDLFERTVSSYEVYSDEKEKGLRVPGADVGTIVGFEYDKKERPYIFQDYWNLQRFLPVENSRYELHVAQGWRFKSDWVNHDPIKPTEQSGTIIWEAKDLPGIDYREPRLPAYQSLMARMVVTFLSDKAPDKSYKDWSQFGSWYSQLAAGVREPTAGLQQKVQELAPVSSSLLDRIKALARFAQQDVRYVEIQIGIGGYRPHKAGDIFNNRYGDCKDKATVLSSMLSEIGIKSYYLLVNTQRGITTETSPPQAMFNHMILAIALPDASYARPLPAIYEHPKLGHLLIFDPTNEFVPFGQIPPYEQDNYGLLVGDNGGELIHLPTTDPDFNRISRTAKLKLLPDGTLQGDVEEVRSGWEAMFGRYSLRHETDKDRKKAIEALLGRSLSAFQVDSYELLNADDLDKDLVIKYKFTAERYAKNSGGLLLVRPRVVGEMAGEWDTSKPRKYPYLFQAPYSQSDNVEISLPDGFKIDELPDPTDAKFPFGEYKSKTESAGNILRYSREYKINATSVPMDHMAELKKLFTEINTDERSSVVLKRPN
jgi:uncharacterized protein DUF3857